MKSLLLAVILVLVLEAAESRLIDRTAVKDLFDDSLRDLLDAPEADTASYDEQKRAEGEGNGPGEKPPSQEDKCNCEENCPEVELPAHLLNESNFFKHENDPIDCRKGSRVYDDKDDNYLCEDLYDCCRKCNADFFQCLKISGGPAKLGVKEKCLRAAYKCMCDCLEENPLNNEHISFP